MKLIIDGNNFAFRPMVTNREQLININNENVTVLHGMIMMIMSLIRQFDVEEIIICWDKGKCKARLELCPDYKGNRTPTEAGTIVRWSIPILQECLGFFGLKQICFPGIEADDTMFVIANALSSLKQNVMVISGDKDVLQVINNRTTVYSFARNKEINLENFQQIVGVPYKGFLDFLCLMGDAADNIKGIPGIGETIAKKLINKFGTYENILENENEIRMLATVKNPEKLMANKAIALFDSMGKRTIEVNRKLIKLGELISFEEKKEILTAYASQESKVDIKGMSEFFQKYCLIENLRNVYDIAKCFSTLEKSFFG